ncbi:hypothetical protein NE237_033241 [Protea cynaroides]|uniref:PGG domain-containing protein n=1 Tax=Protea cynaroides TaxID=273540 RepID=A0A9Q0L6B1_9MAGN|nr:hypothetical protein NE237_033241 [Protea cynaroides]
MDPRLIKVSTNGDIDALYALLGEEPLILENFENFSFTDTPLHWAVVAGHTGFVEEIVNLKPSFTLKLNREGFSPLHLASGHGRLEIVKLLLKEELHLRKFKEAMNIDGDLCNMKGREKRTPLHCAVVAGHIDVLKVFLSNCPDSIKAITVRKETVFHLAVKYGQIDALKVLVSWIQKNWQYDILGWEDQEGNTVLHLATSSRQYEIVKALLQSGLLVRNAVRLNERDKVGLTALDLLMHLPSGPDREEMQAILYSVGAKKAQEMGRQSPATATACVVGKWMMSGIKYVFRLIKLGVDMDTPIETRNALLVVVVLIVTATYQTGLNPPGGYWQQDALFGDYFAGEPIWRTYAPITFNLVMIFNYAGFILSVILAYNLTVGFPLRGPLLVALVFMLITYSWSTPSFNNYIYEVGHYLMSPRNGILFLPVLLILIIWAITSSWMRQICSKFSRLVTGLLRH